MSEERRDGEGGRVGTEVGREGRRERLGERRGDGNEPHISPEYFI